MPILENPRHEAFARELAKGKSATEAYEAAGFKPARQNAHRLITKNDVSARLAELQAIGAEKAALSVESLIAEAEAVRVRAMELGQLSAAVAAIREKGLDNLSQTEHVFDLEIKVIKGANNAARW
jgi:hypothetical protein